jgi:hypothetical protein
MRRTIIVAVATAALSLSGMGLAHARAGDEGSNGNRGLCNAYAHNNQHAKDHGQSFARLAETAGDYDGDQDRDADDVNAYCADNVPAVGN